MSSSAWPFPPSSSLSSRTEFGLPRVRHEVPFRCLVKFPLEATWLHLTCQYHCQRVSLSSQRQNRPRPNSFSGAPTIASGETTNGVQADAKPFVDSIEEILAEARIFFILKRQENKLACLYSLIKLTCSYKNRIFRSLKVGKCELDIEYSDDL